MVFPLAILLGIVAFLSPEATAAQGSPFNCTITATGINFATYDIFRLSPTTATGSIGVTCNNPPQNPASPLTVTISLSSGSSGTFAQRQMTSSGGDRLSYNLCIDPSCVTVFGDGTGGSRTLTNFVTNAAPWNVTFYGRIPAGQDVSAGSYADSVTVTVDW